jgi:hypothetical protein
MPSIIKVDQIQSDTGTVNQTSNLSFTGTGRRIRGDFSNTTVANRLIFQTSTTDGSTSVGVIPNGTSVTASVALRNNSDPTNSGLFSLQINSTDARVASSITGTGTYLPLTMYTGGSERMRITTAGVVELTSGQLKFPASQNASSDANTLDDYEEGTWTPTYLGGSSNPTVSYQAATSGNYVKIGSLVYCRGTLRTSTVSGGSGDVYIGGLPFTVINSVTEQGFSPVHIYVASNGTFAGDYPLSGQTESGTTRAVLFYRTAANGATLALQINDLATSNENFIKFLIMYNAT